MPRDAPPSLAEVTTSFTWREFTEVKTLTSSGISAPASVPQEMIVASFHHWLVSPLPPRLGMMRYEIKYVATIETIEVSQTSEVRGCSKSIFSALAYFAFATAPLTKYANALETSIMMRMTKIQTSS